MWTDTHSLRSFPKLIQQYHGLLCSTAQGLRDLETWENIPNEDITITAWPQVN